MERYHSGGEKECLSGKIIGGVMRALDDVQAFEMLPEGWRRIRQAAVGQGVGEQQVAELIGD